MTFATAVAAVIGTFGTVGLVEFCCLRHDLCCSRMQTRRLTSSTMTDFSTSTFFMTIRFRCSTMSLLDANATTTAASVLSRRRRPAGRMAHYSKHRRPPHHNSLQPDCHRNALFARRSLLNSNHNSSRHGHSHLNKRDHLHLHSTTTNHQRSIVASGNEPRGNSRTATTSSMAVDCCSFIDAGTTTTTASCSNFEQC